MVDKISKDQYNDLCQSSMWDSTDNFHKVLEEMTGITAKGYMAYQYFDEEGNYVGDSNHHTIRDILNNAYIRVVDTQVS